MGYMHNYCPNPNYKYNSEMNICFYRQINKE